MCSDSESWSHLRAEVAVPRYQALLQMMDTLAYRGTLPELMSELGARLKDVVLFEFINFALYDESRHLMVLHVGEGTESPPLLLELELDKSACGTVWQNQKPLVWSEREQGELFPQLYELLRNRGVHSYCVLPLSTPQRRWGAIGFGTIQPDAYSASDLEFLSRVAELVALVLDNNLTRQTLRDEEEKLKALVEVNNSLASSLNVQELFPVISGHMGPRI
jgi:formate hydrogenlyase transcriptional activator